MIPKMVGYHVRPHLTRTRFAIEGLKFGLCLAIPGFSVYIFRQPEVLNPAVQYLQYVKYPAETRGSRSDLNKLSKLSQGDRQ
mmetsp:Transcript_7740/g.18793  ORF Transcript_7740/g.18793 Transcript_7740/m.18793 type:complete len:82 (+) Transcript_7740:194-439(+)